ncbi:hypothetical protein KKJ06_20730 [Xenorhabdus bovienii]|uniref:Lipoprotein n=1 Tax=Xenorhabdus bovienii str. Intermedium TaxID=1379677 RepID=A0A077Q4T2_XENBV|nr:hypothetical protein [Xenorhabdus bovienii]MDE9557770.1 hypothetical protein [Xenorhabdus bovienii]CDH31132.1 conserved exported hypothetical protein [Xenorhabdus bovienii str. Intermedium]
MKKLVVLLAGVSLLSGCVSMKDTATTYPEKYNYLMHVSEGRTYRYEGGKISESFETARNKYLELASVTEEPETFKRKLVDECFRSGNYPSRKDFECTYKFYLEKINDIRGYNKAKEQTKQHQLEIESAKKDAQALFRRGAKLSEDNIALYCDASAKVITSAYVRAARTFGRYDTEYEKIMLGVSDKMFDRLVKKAMSDTKRTLIVRHDHSQETQVILRDVYLINCQSNPKSLILNYSKIFH